MTAFTAEFIYRLKDQFSRQAKAMAQSAQRLERTLNSSVCKTKFARKIRDKQISHTDFKTILGEIKKPDPAKIDEINEALDAAQAIFAYVIQSVLKKDDIIEPDYVGADAMWTLNMLYRGDEAFKEEIRTAEPTCPPEWVLKRVD